jgi:hypothetical protein
MNVRPFHVRILTGSCALVNPVSIDHFARISAAFPVRRKNFLKISRFWVRPY